MMYLCNINKDTMKEIMLRYPNIKFKSVGKKATQFRTKQSEVDALNDFIRTCCIVDPHAFLEKKEFYDLFKTVYNYKISQKTASRYFADNAIPEGRPYIENIQRRGWFGLRLRKEGDVYETGNREETGADVCVSPERFVSRIRSQNQERPQTV